MTMAHGVLCSVEEGKLQAVLNLSHAHGGLAILRLEIRDTYADSNPAPGYIGLLLKDGDLHPSGWLSKDYAMSLGLLGQVSTRTVDEEYISFEDLPAKVQEVMCRIVKGVQEPLSKFNDEDRLLTKKKTELECDIEDIHRQIKELGRARTKLLQERQVRVQQILNEAIGNAMKPISLDVPKSEDEAQNKKLEDLFDINKITPVEAVLSAAEYGDYLIIPRHANDDNSRRRIEAAMQSKDIPVLEKECIFVGSYGVNSIRVFKFMPDCDNITAVWLYRTGQYGAVVKFGLSVMLGNLEHKQYLSANMLDVSQALPCTHPKLFSFIIGGIDKHKRNTEDIEC